MISIIALSSFGQVADLAWYALYGLMDSMVYDVKRHVNTRWYTSASGI